MGEMSWDPSPGAIIRRLSKLIAEISVFATLVACERVAVGLLCAAAISGKLGLIETPVQAIKRGATAETAASTNRLRTIRPGGLRTSGQRRPNLEFVAHPADNFIGEGGGAEPSAQVHGGQAAVDGFEDRFVDGA